MKIKMFIVLVFIILLSTSCSISTKYDDSKIPVTAEVSTSSETAISDIFIPHISEQSQLTDISVMYYEDCLLPYDKLHSTYIDIQLSEDDIEFISPTNSIYNDGIKIFYIGPVWNSTTFDYEELFEKHIESLDKGNIYISNKKFIEYDSESQTSIFTYTTTSLNYPDDSREYLYLLHFSEETSHIYTSFALIDENYDISNIIKRLLNWSESIQIVSQPYTVVNKINDTNKWEDLIFASNLSNKYIDLISAFLKKDLALLSSLTFTSQEDYENFEFPKINEYSIMIAVNADNSYEVLFEFDVEEKTEIFSSGINKYRIKNGIPGVYFEKISDENELSYASTFLENMLSQYSWNIDPNNLSEKPLSRYNMYYNILVESQKDNCIYIMVQFYHDASCFIPSHLIQYKLFCSEGEYSLIESQIISKSDFEPLVWVV